MQFLYPGFLWALLALAIPVIIHLFYFRRFKKVKFTNVKYLKEIKEESSARRKLKNWLVLLMRLLAFTALILAFAQPFFPQGQSVQKGNKLVSLYVDNSFSMSALSEDVPLIDKARQRAREIVNAYSAEDQFQILSNNFAGKEQRLVAKEDALTLIDEIAIAPEVRSISAVVKRQQQALGNQEDQAKEAYLISDFQKNSTDLSHYQDSSLHLHLVPLQAVQEQNISLDSAWFEAPVQMLNQTNRLLVKVRNHGNEKAENIRLTMMQEGQIKPIGTLSIPAYSSLTDTVNITVLKTGWQLIELNITDYPIQFDDKLYLAYQVDEEINVLLIHDQNKANRYLSSAFQGLPYFKVSNSPSNTINYASLGENKLIVLDDLREVSSGLGQELKQYVESGGNLLIFPSANSNVSSYRSFLSQLGTNELKAFKKGVQEVSNINTEEFIFNDVFEKVDRNIKLPITQGAFEMTSFGSRKEEKLLTYRNGDAYLAKYKLGKGQVYLSAAPLADEQNNLVKSGEIFIPMLYKMAISSATTQQIMHIIGADEVLEIPNQIGNAEMVYKLNKGAYEFIPQQKAIGPNVILSVNNQIKEAGFYNLFLNKNEILGKYGFNYDRTESALSYLNIADLKAQLGDQVNYIENTALASLTPMIGEQSRGKVIWKYLLIAALLFLLLESLILRFWKT